MTQLIATALDTTGIQSYIFGSNRLRENIGASYLVSQTTEQWARDALIQLGEQVGQPIYPYDPAKNDSSEPRIQTGEVIGELFYAGGGNTTLLFTDIKYAIQFTQILSVRMLKEAPGIQLVVAHQSFNWSGNTALNDVFETLMGSQLPAKKQMQNPSAPLLGLGVTADCQSTQLVAVDLAQSRTADGRKKYDVPDDNDYRISREIAEKLKSVTKANLHLRDTVFKSAPSQYEIPRDFDDFGRAKGDISYIAVVHADGNNMGQRFQDYGKGRSNADYIIAMRKLSHSINQAGIRALETLTQQLLATIRTDDNGTQAIKTQYGTIPLHKRYLPFRPLVYGGDDVTFVCDARLSLDLATAYLQAFEAQPAADGKPLHACAGISIVKVHYPFARAYQTSESLCQTAKKYVRESVNKNLKGSFSALDWHIATSGLIGTVAEIRQRKYTVAAGVLTMRPIRLQSDGSDWRTWEGFGNIVNQFKEHPDWADRQNKIFALREVLRKGDKAVKEFLITYKLQSLPAFPETNSNEPRKLAEAGWVNERCGYFDAIESMDFYSALGGVSSQNKEQSKEISPDE